MAHSQKLIQPGHRWYPPEGEWFSWAYEAATKCIYEKCENLVRTSAPWSPHFSRIASPPPGAYVQLRNLGWANHMQSGISFHTGWCFQWKVILGKDWKLLLLCCYSMRWENQVWGEDRKGEDLLTVGKSVLEVVEAGKKKWASRPGRNLVLAAFNMAYSILDYKGSMVTFVIDIQIVLVILGTDHSVSTSYNIQSPMSSERSSQ